MARLAFHCLSPLIYGTREQAALGSPTNAGSVGCMSFEAVGALREPVRRAVYEFVAGRGEPVSRNDVADATGLGRTLAAFHLDKLTEAGLLEASFAPRVGGPGAGRPAKLYRRADVEHAVSLPPRDYGLMADVLATAVAEAGAEPAAYAAARARGAALAGGAVTLRLGELGYEPYDDGGTVRLRNCPFHVLAGSHPGLICGLNHALLEGLAAGYDVRLDPGPTGCCVALSSKNKDD